MKTYNEIVKGLECCKSANCSDCKGCPYKNKSDPTRLYVDCCNLLMTDALNLINDQKAEADRLADRNHKCIYLSDEETTEYCVDGPCPKFKTEAQIGAEAVKEFAERLKKDKIKPEFPWDDFTVTEGMIDELLKEFTEGKNDE